jgi:hypothetical protein
MSLHTINPTRKKGSSTKELSHLSSLYPLDASILNPEKEK